MQEILHSTDDCQSLQDLQSYPLQPFYVRMNRTRIDPIFTFQVQIMRAVTMRMIMIQKTYNLILLRKDDRLESLHS